jgi:hypothetical protein
MKTTTLLLIPLVILGVVYLGNVLHVSYRFVEEIVWPTHSSTLESLVGTNIELVAYGVGVVKNAGAPSSIALEAQPVSVPDVLRAYANTVILQIMPNPFVNPSDYIGSCIHVSGIVTGIEKLFDGSVVVYIMPKEISTVSCPVLS